MRRWLTVLLILLAQTQWVCATMSPYWSHGEESPPVWHLISHLHGDEADPSHARLEGVGASNDVEHHHHAPLLAPLLALPEAVPSLPSARAADVGPYRFASHIPSLPERPDRTAPAAAGRSGGVVRGDLSRS